MKSEMKMPRDRDQEVKCPKNSREFSRNETLAGYCSTVSTVLQVLQVLQVLLAHLWVDFQAFFCTHTMWVS